MTTKPAFSALEYHVLLAIAAAPQYGYEIKESVEAESGGALSPPAGSLYRVIARLIGRGLVVETEPGNVPAHPGHPRRYYGLTPEGHAALAGEVSRLREVAELARRRLRAIEGRA